MGNLLQTIRRRLRNKHKKLPGDSEKTDNFTSYVKEYSAYFKPNAVSEEVFDVSFASPLQDLIYDTPSSIYQKLSSQIELGDSVSDNSGLGNEERNLQEPIYATLKKTRDMGSQTDFIAPSLSLPSSVSSSSVSISPSPPPPPPPPPPCTVDPLKAFREQRAKNKGNNSIKPKENAIKNPIADMLLELEKKLEKRRKGIDPKD